ncbi:MAG: flagellar biosynthesis anti-sigma factor FlgM [Steroidobacteraceae bacterium]
MANRIKGLDGGSIGPGSGNPIEKISITKPVATGGSNSAPAAETDSVHITQSARALQALSQAVQDSPEVDSARVSAVQQQIESGQYSANPDRIASRLLQLEQDLRGAAAQ